jgi:hypothetical protein
MADHPGDLTRGRRRHVMRDRLLDPTRLRVVDRGRDRTLVGLVAEHPFRPSTSRDRGLDDLARPTPNEATTRVI